MTTIAANTHPTMMGIKSLLDTPPEHSLASYNFVNKGLVKFSFQKLPEML